MVTPSSIAVTEGAGKLLDVVEVITSAGTVQREMVTLGDPTHPEQRAFVDVDGNLQVTGTVNLSGSSLDELGGNPDSSTYVSMTSDPNGDFGAGVNLLELLMDTSQSVGLNTNVLNWPKQDAKGALLLSDAPQTISWVAKDAASPLVIDTTGYQQVVIQQTTNLVITPTTSNDGVNYIAANLVQIGANQLMTIIGGTGIYSMPVTGRFLKLTSTAGTTQCTIQLRNTPFNIAVGSASGTSPGYDLIRVAGSNVVTAGIIGLLAVGGNIASGVLPTANPLLMAGIDTTVSATGVTTRLTRTIATDTNGRIQAASIFTANDKTGTQLEAGVIASPELGLQAQLVSDQTRWNGMTLIEIAAQQLFEQRMTNYYLYNLPEAIRNGSWDGPTPDDFRAEPGLFD